MKAFWTVVITIVVLAILGYGGYRLYHHFTWKQTATPTAMTQTTTMKPKPTEAMMAAAVYKTENTGKLGVIVTDPKGMTLYTFTKDKTGVSNCNGACAQLWPPYTAKSQTGTASASITVIKRSDGTLQYAWKGMPLYYYSKDTKAGDTSGNGFAGLWNVVKQ